jgi:hypothetical protein
MAKNKKSSVCEAVSPASNDSWQTREDCNDLMKSAALRKDKARFGRAMDMMKNAVDTESDKGSVRMKAPRGSRTATRSISRR